MGAEAPTDFFFLFTFILNLSLLPNLSPLKIVYPYLRPHLSHQKKKRERKEQKKSSGILNPIA